MAEKGDALNNIIYVIEHWQLAEPDAGRQHLIAHGFDVRVVEPWKGEQLPDLTGNEAGVMIMGGPQMVSEASENHNPFLLDELRFIEQTMTKEVPLVGVCLGSQMIARSMGAKVGYHPDDQMAMGFYGIEPTEEGKALGLANGMTVLNGNTQGWELPDGAELLATSAANNPFPNQAFKSGKTLALQFHPEVTRKILDQWQTEFASSIGRTGTQSKTEQNYGFETYQPTATVWYKGVLEEWFGKLES